MAHLKECSCVFKLNHYPAILLPWTQTFARIFRTWSWIVHLSNSFLRCRSRAGPEPAREAANLQPNRTDECAAGLCAFTVLLV